MELKYRKAPIDLIWSLISLAFFSGGFFYPMLAERGVLSLPLCLFKWLSAFPCATCGATRSLVLFSHGQVVDALVMNPLISLLCLYSCAVMAYTISVRLFRAPRFSFEPSPAMMLAFRIGVPSLILFNWGYTIWAGR